MMDQGFFRKRRGWTERLTDLVPDLEIHIIPDSNIITIYLVGVMMTSILTSGYTCSLKLQGMATQFQNLLKGFK